MEIIIIIINENNSLSCARLVLTWIRSSYNFILFERRELIQLIMALNGLNFEYIILSII